MKDTAGNETHVGDKVWFTFEDSLNFYEGRIVSLDEDFGRVVIKDKSGRTYERAIWSVLKASSTITQENNNQIPKKICISFWNSENDSIIKTLDLDEFYGADELRIKL